LANWKTNHLIWDIDFFSNTQVIWDRGRSSYEIIKLIVFLKERYDLDVLFMAILTISDTPNTVDQELTQTLET
jgi:hypothetical protein